MVAEPPIVVTPLLQVPALLPQLVSERESMFEFPPAEISPRTTRAAGGSRNRIWYTVAVIFCLALRTVPEPAIPHAVATMFRSLEVAPFVTDTVNVPICAPFTETGTAVLPS